MHSTMTLSEDEARTFAEIYVFLLKLAGPHFWASLLLGPNQGRSEVPHEDR